MQNITVSGGGTPGNPPGPNLSIAGGLARCGTLTFGENGSVFQSGGDFFVTNDLSFGGSGTDYQLRGGILHTPSLTMGPSSSFDQLGGTNDIAGDLSLSNCTYWLYGGRLQSASIGVGPGAALNQQGGTNSVNGVLSVWGAYNLQPGNLVVEGLYLRGTLFLAGNNAYYTNFGLMDLGGTINTRTGEAAGGQVRLSADAVITFSGDFGASQHLRFNSSAAIAWTGGAVLTIANWDNTTNGPDHTRLYFGTDASGLTASQLGQIIFSNPGGLAPGNYPAQLLSTGELVPVSAPTLQWARSGSALVLTWPSGYELLSATNVNGPYSPVSGASSPWTNPFSKPHEFFRVQSP
jgi:hypothetical protein